MAPFITHAGGRSCRRLMRWRTGSPVTNSTAWPSSSTRSMRIGCACAGTSLTLTTESAPDVVEQRARPRRCPPRTAAARSAAGSSPRRADSLRARCIHCTACWITGRCGVSSLRQLRRAHERHVAPERSRPAVGDGFVFGRENHAIERAGSARGVDRVGEQRLARQQLQVLAGNALGSAAGRDDAENFQVRSQESGLIRR